jgi:hypothetical protein
MTAMKTNVHLGAVVAAGANEAVQAATEIAPGQTNGKSANPAATIMAGAATGTKSETTRTYTPVKIPSASAGQEHPTIVGPRSRPDRTREGAEGLPALR